MSELVKIKYEVEDLQDALNALNNKVLSREVQVYNVENNSLEKLINFTVKSLVDLEVMVIGNTVTELKIYLNNELIYTGNKKVVALKLNCLNDRRHSVKIVLNGASIESCYVCLTAPKIKKI